MERAPKCGSTSRDGAQLVLVKNSFKFARFSKNGRASFAMKKIMNTTAAVGMAVTARRTARPRRANTACAAQLRTSIIRFFSVFISVVVVVSISIVVCKRRTLRLAESGEGGHSAPLRPTSATPLASYSQTGMYPRSETISLPSFERWIVTKLYTSEPIFG